MKLSIDRNSKRKWDKTILDIEPSEKLTKFLELVKGDWERFLREDEKTINKIYQNKFYSDNLINIKSQFIINNNSNKYEKKRLLTRIKKYIFNLFKYRYQKKS